MNQRIEKIIIKCIHDVVITVTDSRCFWCRVEELLWRDSFEVR